MPSPEELRAWLEYTLRVAEPGTTVQTAVREMQDCVEWLPVCHLLPSANLGQEAPFKGTLILFISHWRTEASGAYQILDQVFDFASDLMEGKQTRESLSVHTLGNEAALLTPDSRP